MSIRICHCTGYLTNPGGACCMDLQGPSRTWTSPTTNPTPSEPTVIPFRSPRTIKKIEYYEDGTVKSIEYYE